MVSLWNISSQSSHDSSHSALHFLTFPHSPDTARTQFKLLTGLQRTSHHFHSLSHNSSHSSTLTVPCVLLHTDPARSSHRSPRRSSHCVYCSSTHTPPTQFQCSSSHFHTQLPTPGRIRPLMIPQFLTFTQFHTQLPPVLQFLIQFSLFPTVPHTDLSTGP